MKQINLGTLLVFIFYAQSCYKEAVVFDALPNNELELALILELNDKDCFFDQASNRLRYAIGADSIQNFTPYVRFQDYSEVAINHIPLTNNSLNNLGNIRLNETYTVQITTKGMVKELTLSFTNLPMVQIVTPNQIIDEPQKLARFTINYSADSSNTMTSFVGIDFRGGSAQFNPKKSYGFSFLKTMDLGSKTSKALFGWEPKEDWILDALYNDGSRLRNKISFEIWHAMNPFQHQAIQSKWVELYVNNDCQGLYCLNEQMNAEQLNLTDSEAVLYKATAWGDGATTFEYLSSAAPLFVDVWDGWEQKYPKPKDRIHWQPLYELRDLIVHKSALEFVRDIEEQIDLAIFIEYYIFLNLISATDNTGKNIIWARPNAQAPFFIIPWDLDGSWGRFWDGTNSNATTILSNKLFDRLLALNPNNFKGNLKRRWLALRGGVLSYSNLENVFEDSFNEIGRSDILAIENRTWNSRIHIQQEQQYIKNWTLTRLNFLDVYFSNL